MACDCIETINAEIASKNTRLTLAFQMGGTVSLIIDTEVIEKKRGARPLLAIPTYCPFCGTKYDAAPALSGIGREAA